MKNLSLLCLLACVSLMCDMLTVEAITGHITVIKHPLQFGVNYLPKILEKKIADQADKLSHSYSSN